LAGKTGISKAPILRSMILTGAKNNNFLIGGKNPTKQEVVSTKKKRSRLINHSSSQIDEKD